MHTLTLHEARLPLRREICAWQRAAFGLFALSLAWSMGQTAANVRLTAELRETEARLEQAENTRDYAVKQLGAMVLQSEADKLARAEQAAAYEAMGGYTYIGECVITAYCPCEECCGQWADGLTATGIPAGPGIAAVDPDVIPLGSTVIIDGQRYLAADTGIAGQAVDICVAGHQEAENFGVQAAGVWIIDGGQNNG